MCAAVLGVFSAQAQENLGIANSNYAPTNTVLLNPSSIADPKVWLDINIVGASGFGQNNFVYLDKNQYYFPRNTINIPDASYRTDRKRINGTLDAAIHGPSAVLSIKKHSVGIYTGLRSYTNARRIPGRIAELVLDDLSYDESDWQAYSARNARIKSMTWAEFGVNYGVILHQFSKNMWTGGVTAKRLIGINSTDLLLRRLDVEPGDSTLMVLNELDGRYAYAEPAWGAGKGWGIDLGVTYKKMLEDIDKYIPHDRRTNCKIPDYKYTIGLSMLDLGYMRYKNNAFQRSFDRNSETVEVNSIDDLTIVDAENGGTTGKTRFTSKTPLAFSLQGDYNFENDFYVNATIVQRIGWARSFGVERPNTVSVTPRYERRMFEAALPISLHDYYRPQVGLAFRFAYVVVGTDNIIPFLVRSDVYGADVYFSLKYTIFSSPECRVKQRKDRKVHCPAPDF